MTKTFIIVRFTFEASHFWEGAGGTSEPYLKHPHRHRFHVEAKREVTHDDRDVEFIAFQRGLEAFARRTWVVHNPTPSSCEAMARVMLDTYHLTSCKVFEDGENGAEVLRVEDFK